MAPIGRASQCITTPNRVHKWSCTTSDLSLKWKCLGQTCLNSSSDEELFQQFHGNHHRNADEKELGSRSKGQQGSNHGDFAGDGCLEGGRHYVNVNSPPKNTALCPGSTQGTKTLSVLVFRQKINGAVRAGSIRVMASRFELEIREKRSLHLRR